MGLKVNYYIHIFQNNKKSQYSQIIQIDIPNLLPEEKVRKRKPENQIMKWWEMSQTCETRMDITRPHLKILTEMHWNPGLRMVISHPGGQDESACDRQMGLNEIMLKYRQHYLSDRERENCWDDQISLQNCFLSLWMWAVPNAPWSN